MMAQISGNMKENKDKQAESSALQTMSGRFGSNRIETPSTNHARDDNRNQAKLPKIDFPYLNGEGPREWVRKAMKYFQLHQVADELKVGIAEMYLKGKADIWFHGFAASHPNAEWNVFTSELCRRFSETKGEEVIEAFSKIRQFGSITEYQEKFEELKAQVMLSLPHLPETYYISIFTSGLKGEIKSMVKMLKPISLTQAFEIATLQENTISAINKTQKMKHLTNTTPRWNNPISKNPDSNITPQNTTKYPKPHIPYKIISPADFQAKRALNLCYK
ncbi:Uncharacterized protein Adt_11396 [Abeliophyllum distichum]|uniref:Ty3 transposon capsid-like protein domain-containing protein n=1 Tax=Abeliophyllum distichum TaxID=126358 RepID=A0ABD1UN52_9LAMI